MDELTRLAHAARQSRPRALERFIEAGYPDVWRLCASLLDAQFAEDLAQETFLRATQALPRFRGESSARTWLLSIAHRVCIDELRARGRRRQRDQRLERLAMPTAIDPDVAGEIDVRQLLARLDPIGAPHSCSPNSSASPTMRPPPYANARQGRSARG